MKNFKTNFYIIGFAFISIALISSCKTREEKVLSVINKFGLVNNVESNLSFQLEYAKVQATGNDSLRVIELEKKISDEDIPKRLSKAFTDSLTKKEINSLYKFSNSTAFDKYYKSQVLNNAVELNFKDINDEITQIQDNINNYNQEDYSNNEPSEKFTPIPVDRENGFYATTFYMDGLPDSIKLEDKPSLTIMDIETVKKDYNLHDNRVLISINFTNEGARKFYNLTKNNIGKPIAIVIDKKIVSAPRVIEGIMGGKAQISGNFTEEEIDEMIKILKGGK